MKVHKLAMLTATMALGIAPTLALAANSNGHHTGKPSTTPPTKAYGKYCQGQSKTHVAGTPGTPFSECVTDMAKLANGSSKNPRTACKDESKKHVAGAHGTPFSLCVSGGAKLLKNQASS
jgi:hypothetical protein